MLEPVLPIALYLLGGYLFKLFSKDLSKELIEFVIYFSLPSLVFSAIYKMEYDHSLLATIYIAYGVIITSLIFSYIVAKMLQLPKKSAATFMIVSTFGNTSFIGFSYIEAFYDTSHLIYALVYDQFGSFLLLMSVGMVVITWGGGAQRSLSVMFKNIILFPPIIAIAIAFFSREMGVPLFVLKATDTVGATLVPIVMVAIGMKLELANISSQFKEVSISIAIKMIIAPLVLYVILQYLYGMGQNWVQIAIIETAMPTMTMAVVLAIKGGLDERFAINALVLGVLFSLFSITSFYYFVR
jgi:predicted permease